MAPIETDTLKVKDFSKIRISAGGRPIAHNERVGRPARWLRSSISKNSLSVFADTNTDDCRHFAQRVRFRCHLAYVRLNLCAFEAAMLKVWNDYCEQAIETNGQERYLLNLSTSSRKEAP